MHWCTGVPAAEHRSVGKLTGRQIDSIGLELVGLTRTSPVLSCFLCTTHIFGGLIFYLVELVPSARDDISTPHPRYPNPDTNLELYSSAQALTGLREHLEN